MSNLLGLPFRPEEVAFGARCPGFEGRGYEECRVLYRVVRGADSLAAGAEVEVAAVRRSAWGDRPAHALGMAAAGVAHEIGDFTDLIEVEERNDNASGGRGELGAGKGDARDRFSYCGRGAFLHSWLGSVDRWGNQKPCERKQRYQNEMSTADHKSSIS